MTGALKQVRDRPPWQIAAGGIASGSVYFTQCPPGVVWVQGTNSRTTPTIHTAAMWANLNPPGIPPLRLTAPPSPAAKVITLLGADLIAR